MGSPILIIELYQYICMGKSIKIQRVKLQILVKVSRKLKEKKKQSQTIYDLIRKYSLITYMPEKKMQSNINRINMMIMKGY